MTGLDDFVGIGALGEADALGAVDFVVHGHIAVLDASAGALGEFGDFRFLFVDLPFELGSAFLLFAFESAQSLNAVGAALTALVALTGGELAGQIAGFDGVSPPWAGALLSTTRRKLVVVARREGDSR